MERPRDEAEVITQTPTRFSRAPSHAPVEGGMRPPQGRRYQESLPTYERVLMRDDGVFRTPAYRETEIETGYQSQPMQPPHRRVVIDQYGHQFYEYVQPSRSSVAPRARLIDKESYNDVATLANGSVRATSVLRDPYPEARVIQEMSPPQVSYRRVTEIPRNAMIQSRMEPEPQYEPRQIHRSASVQLHEYPSARQTLYAETGPREVIRMSSVRPVAARYEESQGEVQRVQSVRPEGREMSVYVDDRAPIRREYVPVRPPAYEVRKPAPDNRYYEVDDSQLMLDGAMDERQYIARRY